MTGWAAPAKLAGELVLVRDGAEAVPVVVFEDAPQKTRLAAEELADYIEKTSGVRPEVIEGAPDPVPEHAIWVGYQPLLDELFPDLDFDFQHPEEILIAANDRHLVIVGRDIWDPDNMTARIRRGTVTGVQLEYGTVNAVYTFLQDYLGVRWFWPGELGEDILPQERIAFEPFEFRYHPQVRGRRGILRNSSFDGIYAQSYDWTRLQRLRLDSLPGMGGGGGFHGWWERFHETNPDFFALQPDGTRTPFPSKRNVKMCKSNPALWEQWMADVEASLESNPNRRVFNASFNDSWANGFCVCESCRAWDHPDGEPRGYRWAGHREILPAISDRHVTFANKLGELLKERYPDEDYYVLMYAYGNSRPAPVEAVPADNVIMNSVANFMLRPDQVDRGSPLNSKHRDQFAAWGEIAPNLAWRPNTGSGVGFRVGMPDVPLTQTIADWKFVAENNNISFYIDTVWEHWATQGPLYYAMAHLAWDPYQDADALMEDYYQRAFGPAVEPMKDYWAWVEEARNEAADTDQNWGQVKEGTFFETAQGLLDEAAARAAGDELYRDRVAFVRAGLEYARLLRENYDLMDRYRESDETDQAAADQARANWEVIEQIWRDYPEAINSPMLHPERVNRLHRAHPDY